MTQRERLLRWEDPAPNYIAQRGMTGLEMLTAMRDGELPGPPIAAAMRMALTEVEAGRAVFVCDPDESLYNPFGTVHGGAVCTVLDSATGCAVGSTLARGMSYTSIEIKVSFLRPITERTGRLTATGTVTKPGRRVMFADGALTDDAGTLLATTSGSFLVFPTPGPEVHAEG